MMASLNFTQALIHKKHVRRIALGASVIIAALSTPVLNAQINAGASNAMPSLAPMLETTTAAVVNISVVRSQRMPDQLRFFGGSQMPQPPVRQSRGAGSGVVVDSDEGLIITNHHVVDGADTISVSLQDGRVLDATLIGSDQRTDIALLRIEAERLTALPLADVESLRVGDYVVAIGNPFGLGQTVTSGIISALGRAGLNDENYEDFIQTDAAINVGNSGGALVDLQGRLVGINTAIISGSGTNSGVGFAVPVDMVEAVMGHLLRDGVVERGQLGVLITDHTALVEEALELGAERGALVTQVFPGSAAERAGLQATDLVIGINDKAVNSSRDLRNAVGLAGIDQDMKIDVLRDGDPLLISVRLENASSNQSAAGGDRQTNERSATESRFLGAQLQDLPDGRAGVGVATVDPQSRAAAGGLQAGDMITALNRQSVDDLAELNSLLSAQPPLLALNVERDGQSLLLIMP